MSERASLFEFLRLVRGWLARRRLQRENLATLERLKNRKAEVRDAMWTDFQDAELNGDAERLADIGDWIEQGVPQRLFNLTANERIVVEAYIRGGGGNV